MTVLEFDKLDTRLYSQGLDRGVLYIPGKDPVVWNGMTAFEESGNGSSNTLYRDGVIYLADQDATDFTGKLSAFFYPDEFAECLGIPAIAEGFFVDNQKPKRFSFAYRTLIGSGLKGDQFGYQIHLVYNAIASIGSKSRETINESPKMQLFTFDLVCTPVKYTGFRPSAHYIIDTRFLGPNDVATLEGMLYGTATTTGSMPTVQAIGDLLTFGSAIKVKNITNGAIVTGSSTNVIDNGNGSATIKGINAVDTSGSVYVSNGGNTTVT